MGAACYKEKTLVIKKDQILKVVQDHYLNETLLTESILAN